MSDSDRGVPRADNVPAGEREENEQRSEHRAHGRAAQEREDRRSDVNVEPGEAEGGPRGSAGWGSEPSGGSVIDKR
jgi:hypothetical protein